MGGVSLTGQGAYMLRMMLAYHITREMKNAIKQWMKLLSCKFKELGGDVGISKYGDYGIFLNTERMPWAYSTRLSCIMPYGQVSCDNFEMIDSVLILQKNIPLPPLSRAQRIISMCTVPAPPPRTVVTQNSCLCSRPDTITMEVDENVPPNRVGSTVALLTDISYNSPDLRSINSYNEDASAYLNTESVNVLGIYLNPTIKWDKHIEYVSGDVISLNLGLIGIAMEEEITMTKKNNDSEFVDNTDEYTDENIDEDIEEPHYGNRDMILNEEVTMREENIVEECVEHINEEINANIDVNIDEQHFRNQKIILNECTGIFDIVEDSSSSQDEKKDETMPTKYNKKNN
ncbi:hypothetical protein HHI36_014522 [Cryptolaemus montrouzieri]|uniref:Uncharacterized protein n=1 Tax=Cryptolaemus montrouzieri TaxID=559131 RepID=A0ABD2N3H5_9CUCU